MGNFPGHAIPGTFFLLFAVWWTIAITRRILVCQAKGIHFYNTVTYSCRSCLSFPLEAVIKLLVTSIGMAIEISSSIRPIRSGRMGADYDDVHGFLMHDVQHVTMYGLFFISSLFDLMVNCKTVLVPPGVDYIVTTLAFILEGLLFAFHGHGLSALESTVHLLLLYSIIACCIALLVEYKYHSSPYAAYCRAYFTFLQGTWFWQVAFILYPPNWMKQWDPSNHDNLMLACAIFTWHMVLVLFCMVTIAGITYHCTRKRRSVRHDTVEYKFTGFNEFEAIDDANNTIALLHAISGEEEKQSNDV